MIGQAIRIAGVIALATSFTNAQASPAQDSGIAALADRMRREHGSVRSLRLTLEYRGTVPGGVGGKPIELTARMRVQSLRVPAAAGGTEQRYARLDVDLMTPEGPLKTEKVRTPGGIWLHQASELTGQKWLRVDPSTMRRLDQAAEVFGSAGALRPGETARPGAVIGAELLEGLARSYRLSTGEDRVVGDEPCESVRAELEHRLDSELGAFVPRERPNEILLAFSKKDLFLREMIQKLNDRTTAALTVRDVEINPKLDPADFKLVPPEGVRFQDVMSDPVAAIRIRMDLKKLDEWQARQRGKADSKEPGGEEHEKKGADATDRKKR